MLTELLHEYDRLLLLQECHWLLTDDRAADWNGHTVRPGMQMHHHHCSLHTAASRSVRSRMDRHTEQETSGR